MVYACYSCWYVCMKPGKSIMGLMGLWELQAWVLSRQSCKAVSNTPPWIQDCLDSTHACNSQKPMKSIPTSQYLLTRPNYHDDDVYTPDQWLTHSSSSSTCWAAESMLKLLTPFIESTNKHFHFIESTTWARSRSYRKWFNHHTSSDFLEGQALGIYIWTYLLGLLLLSLLTHHLHARLHICHIGLHACLPAHGEEMIFEWLIWWSHVLLFVGWVGCSGLMINK